MQPQKFLGRRLEGDEYFFRVCYKRKKNITVLYFWNGQLNPKILGGTILGRNFGMEIKIIMVFNCFLNLII